MGNRKKDDNKKKGEKSHSLVFIRLHNQTTENFKNKMDNCSTQSVYEMNLREYKREDSKINKSRKNIGNINKSHQNFCENMKGLENKRNKKMLQLMIDKEN